MNYYSNEWLPESDQSKSYQGFKNLSERSLGVPKDLLEQNKLHIFDWNVNNNSCSRTAQSIFDETKKGFDGPVIGIFQ